MSRPSRGFTLLEALVVVAIIGAIAALAVPNLVPMVRLNKARGAGELIANVLEDARRRAVAEGRCYRVRIPSSSTIAIERRSSVDCTNDAAFATDPWDPPARTINIPGAALTVTDTAAAGAGNQIIFRPNSRLRGNGTLTTAQYGARVLATMSGGGFADVDIDQHGRICVRITTTAPGALTAPVTCP